MRGEAPAWPLVLLAVALLGAGCGDGEEVEVAGPELLQIGASQVMVDVETYVTREGLRRAHLVADTAFFLEGESGVNLRRVRVDFFADEGFRSSRLTARRGWYEMQSGDMRTEGEVVVIDSASGRRLETPRLEYRAGRDELRSDTVFVLYRGNEVIRGESFITDPSLSEIRTSSPSGESRPSGG